MPNRFKTMRPVAVALIGLSSILLQGCSEKIDARQTREVNGLIYKLNADDPFTGTVTHYPLNELLNVGDCELHVKKGQLDGTFTCTTNNGTKVAEVEFTDGKRDGDEKKWDMNSGKLVASLHWKGGAKDGKEEIFDPASSKLLHVINWSNNVKEGEEKVWDASGSQLLTDLDWKNGRQTGYVQGGDFKYKDGQLDGTMDRRGAGGRLLLNFKGGIRDGLQQKWDKDGHLLKEAQYQNGVVQTWKEQTWFDNGKMASTVSLVNPGIADNSRALVELVKDGKEQRWDEKDGHLTYEVTWDKGKPLKGFASDICTRDVDRGLFCESFSGTADPSKDPAVFGVDLVMDGPDRVVDEKGQVVQETIWKMGVPQNSDMSPEAIERHQHFNVTLHGVIVQPLEF